MGFLTFEHVQLRHKRKNLQRYPLHRARRLIFNTPKKIVRTIVLGEMFQKRLRDDSGILEGCLDNVFGVFLNVSNLFQ